MLTDLSARVRLIEDRVAIEELNARYTDAFDNGRSEEFAQMYTPTGNSCSRAPPRPR